MKKDFCRSITTGTKVWNKLLRYHPNWCKAPACSAYYHTHSLDNGRNSRWALLGLRQKTFPPTFMSPFHTALLTAIPPPAALLEAHISMYSSQSTV